MASIEKRKNSDGTIGYRARVRLRGFPLETATFERLTDARAWAAKIEADIRAGRHFGISKRHTLSELIRRYSESELDELKSSRSVKARLAWWDGEVGPWLLSELTPEVIARARDKLRSTPTRQGGRERSAADVNRALAALSAACNYAVKELGWLEKNPMERVRKLAEPKGRTRFLEEHELPKLIDACRASQSPDLLLAVLLSLTTGGRQGEVMGLCWSQVDFKRRTALLGETKNGDRRPLPLSGEALVLLQQRAKVRQLREDRIFPPAPGSKKAAYVNLRKPWVAALKQAGIQDFRWHDLRHTAASYLTMAGKTPLEVAKVLGHRTLAMTARYSHLAPERVVAMGDTLATAMGI